MTEFPESLQRARAAAFAAARDRYSRPRLEPGSRTRSTVGQVAPMLPLEAPPSRAQQRAEYDAAQRSVTRPRAAPAYQEPTNQFAEAGQYGLEATGLPSVRRSARAFASGDMQTGVEEGAMGALGVGSLLVGGQGARAPRPMLEAPPMRAPVAEPGALRVADLPPETFRDFDAFGPRGDYSDALRNSSVVVEDVPLNDLRASHPTTSATVRDYAGRDTPAPPILIQRGPNGIRVLDGNHRLDAARARGDTNIRAIDMEQFRHLAEPPPSGALRPPPRQLGTASDGSVMPVRPSEPFRQSMVGGSDDLAAAARPGALRPAPDGSPSGNGGRRFEESGVGSGAYRNLSMYGDGEDAIGYMEYKPRDDGSWMVRYTSVDPSLRGQGNGVALYEELIRRARASGVTRIVSDAHVSDDAQNVYAALRRRGYQVRDVDIPGYPASEHGQAHEIILTPDGSPSAGARVSDLQSRADPFGPVNLWDESQPPITVAEVRRAMQRGRGEARDYTNTDTQGWSREDHINRIATLARDGWADPIDLSGAGGVHDGLHRLAAAIVRGDETIATRTRQGAFGHGDGGGTRQGPRIENANGSWQIVDESGGVLERLPRGSTFRDADAALQRMTNRGPSQ